MNTMQLVTNLIESILHALKVLNKNIQKMMLSQEEREIILRCLVKLGKVQN